MPCRSGRATASDPCFPTTKLWNRSFHRTNPIKPCATAVGLPCLDDDGNNTHIIHLKHIAIRLDESSIAIVIINRYDGE